MITKYIPNWFKKLVFYRQHPETAVRYAPIIKLLREKNWSDLKILEVGSGSYGITPYLKKPITGVDTEFPEPEYPLLRQVKGSATKLPFKEDEFDIVIFSDVLEHIPVEFREKSIKESIRVAKIAVVISGPFGKKSADQDKTLAEYSVKQTGKMHQFFKEHLELGLPEVEEVILMANKNSKVRSVKIVGEYFSLVVRSLLMKIFITNNRLIYYFYLKGLMVFVPLLKLMNNKPCYRTVIAIELKQIK